MVRLSTLGNERFQAAYFKINIYLEAINYLNVFLSHWFVPQDTLKVERRKIDCLKTVVQDQFTDSLPCHRRLLNIVAAKAVHENKIPYLRMASSDGILIQCVVFVVFGPRTLNLKHTSISS